jgi:class 3 adenylate cyclase
MKRLRYISRASKGLTREDIQRIAQSSSQKNTEKGLTGFLVHFSGLFFQILEGEETVIDRLYFDKIIKDPRHYDILCLGVEYIEKESQFKDWSMKLIDIDEQTEVLPSVLQEVLLTLFKSQNILSQYTQPSVLNIFKSGIDPTTIESQRVNRIIMFADIANFTILTELFPPEEVIRMVNQFIEFCSQRVLEQGGEINKIMGDNVMAYFDHTKGRQAIEASLNILEDLEKYRHSQTEDPVIQYLYTGIGLAQGWVIEGNIGSQIKKDYTLMGDAVNLASRIEAMTRSLQRPIVFSENIARELKDLSIESLGVHMIKGKLNAVPLYSLQSCNACSYDAITKKLNQLQRE